jgi:hypothetical protein
MWTRCNRIEDGCALGTIQVVDCGDKVVLNAITQLGYGPQRSGVVSVRYDAVRAVMRQVNHLAWLTATNPGSFARVGRLRHFVS